MKIHASINRIVNKEDSAIKAYASVTMDGMFAVHGLRVIETEKGRFVKVSYASLAYLSISQYPTHSNPPALSSPLLNPPIPAKISKYFIKLHHLLSLRRLYVILSNHPSEILGFPVQRLNQRNIQPKTVYFLTAL